MSELNRRRALAGLGGSLVAGLMPAGAAQATAYDSTMVVDAGRLLGTFFNPGWYVNHTHPNWYFSRGLLPAGTLKQLQDDFNVRWARAVVKMEKPPASNFPYLDQAASYANRLLLSFTSSTGTEKTPQEWETFMRDALLVYKARYPQIDCVMPWIEPNLGIVGGHPDNTAMTPAEFYPYYAAGYRAVSAANDGLEPAIPLTFGGPTTSDLPAEWLLDFLKRYAADKDARKRLDFLAVQLYHKNRDNPRQALSQRATLRSLLSQAGLSQSVPPYVTEYGVYGGSDTGTVGDLAHDQLVQAAGVAALGRYYVESGMNRPFHWVLHHGENVRKDMFVEGLDGVRLPFGHVVVMQGMLKDRYDDGRRVATTITPDGSTTGGIGLGAISHLDSRQLTVMYWNYQAETGTTNRSTKLTIRNIPKSVFGDRIRVENWLVDATNNNYNHNRTTTFARNAIFSMDRPAEFNRVLSLTKNAVGLLRVTPA
ncbi:hypothetical protein ACWEPC_23140 [Nonomuraea sp. NPDC004297]